MRLDRTWIERNIPHQGRMCLLDEVMEWDAQHIRCRSGTHRLPDHPLHSQGRLGVACGIEYAAQAMAAHGALAGMAGVASAQPAQILINDPRVFPESLTSTADGTIIIGSMDHGTVYRAAPGATKADPWFAGGSGSLGRVLSKPDIAARLFDFNDEAGDNAIELYVGRLRRKLGEVLEIRTLRGLGYVAEIPTSSEK